MARSYHVFIRDPEVSALVGIHDHERAQPQRVRVNLDLYVSLATPKSQLRRRGPDALDQVVDYAEVATKVRDHLLSRHVPLLEALAEEVADLGLEDARVDVVRVQIEKPDILKGAASVGVEIERRNR